MDDADRAHIIKNIPELIRTTKYKELINGCEHGHLLSKVMRNRIEYLTDADETEKHKQLFIKLTKRGPDAYNKLIELTNDLGFQQAAYILKAPKLDDSRYVSMHNRSSNNTAHKPEPVRSKNVALPEGCYPSKDKVDAELTLVPFTKKIQLERPLTVKKSKYIHFDRNVECYSMKSKNRGVFFMVNIIDFLNGTGEKRSGADKDADVLLYLFQEMGFTCFAYTNLRSDGFFEILEKLRSSEYLAQTESFVMALMSHGEMVDDLHDRVQFHDGSIVKVSKIEDYLSNKVCPNLVNKPKVLILPFCRGDAPDKGVPYIQSDSIGQGPLQYIPTKSDMLVCYASVRGYKSLRDPESGAWYIQTFAEVLAEKAHDTHLEDMLKIIGRKIGTLQSAEGYLQVPSYSNNGFNKLLFFNPGVYE